MARKNPNQNPHPKPQKLKEGTVKKGGVNKPPKTPPPPPPSGQGPKNISNKKK